MDQPLFGETRPRVKVFNIVTAVITAIVVTVTVIMGIISSTLLHPHKCHRIYNNKNWFCIYPVDICLCLIIVFLLIPQIVVAYWYRRGELEPKFRTMIYYNAAVTILLCITANLYFFQVGYHKDD